MDYIKWIISKFININLMTTLDENLQLISNITFNLCSLFVLRLQNRLNDITLHRADMNKEVKGSKIQECLGQVFKKWENYSVIKLISFDLKN